MGPQLTAATVDSGRDKCMPNADVHANLHFWTIVRGGKAVGLGSVGPVDRCQDIRLVSMYSGA